MPWLPADEAGEDSHDAESDLPKDGLVEDDDLGEGKDADQADEGEEDSMFLIVPECLLMGHAPVDSSFDSSHGLNRTEDELTFSKTI